MTSSFLPCVVVLFETFLAFSVIFLQHPATAGFDLLEAVAQEPL